MVVVRGCYGICMDLHGGLMITTYEHIPMQWIDYHLMRCNFYSLRYNPFLINDLNQQMLLRDRREV